jgi:hypothetical protein
MDGNRFDAVTRGLSAATSRRGALGFVLGGAFAAGATSTAMAQNRRRRRRRDSDEAEPDAADLVPPGPLAGDIWEETIEVCRFDAEGGYEVVAISPTAVPDHLSRGGTIYLDCCVDSDCPPRVCLTATGCIEGACAYDNLEGTTCYLDDGSLGVCGDDGTCRTTGAAPAPVPVG